MHLALPHRLSRSEATARVRNALEEGRAKIREKGTIDEERWEGSTLHFAFTGQGQHVSGTLEITDTQFIIDAKLPFMLRLFEGQIEKAIQQQAQTMLGQ
jgi:hypothetical protein